MNDPLRPPPDAGPASAELRRPRRKGIYVLPNAVTLAALFAGFYAIVMAMSGRFEVMDSLCDMVSFGLAPALIMLEWGLKGLGKPGWMAAFVYCAAAALRLARFNVNIGVVDKRFFQGLPSPAAAALVIGFIYVMQDMAQDPPSGPSALAWTAFVLTLFAGLSMVTNAPFYSFKVVGGRRTVPFAVIVAIALAIAIVTLHPPLVLFALFCLYGLSGYGVYAWRRLKGKPASVIATSTDEPDEIGLHR